MTGVTLHDVASRIRARRTDLQLSQTRLAAMTGVSRNTLASLEAGHGGMSIDTVLRILGVLDLALDFVEPGSSARAGSFTAGAVIVRPGDVIDLDEIIDEATR